MGRFKVYGETDTDEVIIAIPALGERKEMFEFLSRYLLNSKVVAIDLPGHNNVQQGEYSINSFLIEIEVIMKELKISSAHFIGNSIGAWIIQAFYLKYPLHVKSLTLLDGGFYFIDSNEINEEEVTLPVVERLEDIENAIKETVESMNDLECEDRIHFTSYLKENFVIDKGLYVHHSDEKAINLLSKEVDIKDYTLKHEIDKPILLLLAEKNLDESYKNKLHNYKQLHPNSTVKIVENGYHLLAITNPRKVANFLANYLHI